MNFFRASLFKLRVDIVHAFQTVLAAGKPAKAKHNPWPLCPTCRHRFPPEALCLRCGQCGLCCPKCPDCCEGCRDCAKEGTR